MFCVLHPGYFEGNRRDDYVAERIGARQFMLDWGLDLAHAGHKSCPNVDGPSIRIRLTTPAGNLSVEKATDVTLLVNNKGSRVAGSAETGLRICGYPLFLAHDDKFFSVPFWCRYLIAIHVAKAICIGPVTILLDSVAYSDSYIGSASTFKVPISPDPHTSWPERSYAAASSPWYTRGNWPRSTWGIMLALKNCSPCGSDNSKNAQSRIFFPSTDFPMR